MYVCLGLNEHVNSLLASISVFCLILFIKLTFSRTFFIRNTIEVSNSFDPDQALHFVKPDLGQTCLQKIIRR